MFKKKAINILHSILEALKQQSILSIYNLYIIVEFIVLYNRI
jgi:hypothetical protein